MLIFGEAADQLLWCGDRGRYRGRQRRWSEALHAQKSSNSSMLRVKFCDDSEYSSLWVHIGALICVTRPWR